MEETFLIASPSPHLRSKETIARIMWRVTLSLIPVIMYSAYHFGVKVLVPIVFAMASAMALEVVCLAARRKKIAIVFDGSAALTGLLLAFNVPPEIDLWILFIGVAVAVCIAKNLFGGIGYNLFNPAFIGRAFLLAAWPAEMTHWTLNGVSTATPLGILKEHGYSAVVEAFGSKTAMYWHMFIGDIPGCIGETSALLIIVAGGLLFYWKIINWQTPAAYLMSILLLSWMFGGNSGFMSGDPLFYALSGGLCLAVFVMANDMVTSPLTLKGKFVFGLGCGVLTFIIRKYSAYPEGVSYAVLLMNACTPLIDKYIVNRRYGTQKA